jgi:hypothetical protein
VVIVFEAVFVAIAGIGLLDVVGPVAAEAAAHVRWAARRRRATWR